MANRLYNKQVSPKGYKKGGSVRDTRKTEQMIGASISSKREKGRTRKMGGGMMMQRPMMKKGGAAKGAKPITDPKVLEAIKLIKPPKGKKRLGKMGGGMMMKRPMMQEGGKALKPVKPSQKGLKKLPTEVRNKMGYMKKGGKVNGK